MSHIHIHADEFDNKYAYEAAVRGAEAVAAVADATNGGSEKDVIAGFATQLSCTHRTLQANAVRVMLKGLVKWAQDADVHEQTDLRNEAAVSLVLKLAARINDSPIPFI
jgi:hypothetical protein